MKEMNKSFEVGAKTEIQSIKITRKEVRQYCEVIDEKSHLYYDVTVAKNKGFDDIPLPATYPTLFWQKFNIPWLERKGTIIQGEQSFSYEEPLVANQTYHCQIVLEKVRSRLNNDFLYHRLYIYHGDTVAATGNTTLILIKKDE